MIENIGHAGVWGLAVIMIVLASWILYRYLAPKTWREWAGAGVVQAFIIARIRDSFWSKRAWANEDYLSDFSFVHSDFGQSI